MFNYVENSTSYRTIVRFSSTLYKNNSRDSGKFKGCSPIQLLCNLTGMKPAIGYYSYTDRSKQY